MRRFSVTALAVGACLSAALTFPGSAAAAPAAPGPADATQASQLACSQQVFAGLSGKLNKCSSGDGRIRVFGQLRDTSPANGNTRLRIAVGGYAKEWAICGTDKQIDTGYQQGSAAQINVASSTAISC